MGNHLQAWCQRRNPRSELGFELLDAVLCRGRPLTSKPSCFLGQCCQTLLGRHQQTLQQPLQPSKSRSLVFCLGLAHKCKALL